MSAAPLSMVDWADSHYMYVRSRVLAINPSRFFGGIVQARDWPLKDVTLEGFYLLLGDMTPVVARTLGANSWSAPNYTEKLQWIWQIKGTDISGNNVAPNRGDRYRTNFQMTQELLQGMFPGFCEKFTWSVSADDNGNPVFQGTPFNPPETCWSPKPVFSNKYNASTGILTGFAITAISSYGPTLTS